MRIAIVGISNSGKSTVFNTLTKSNIETSAYTVAKEAPNISVIKVPDERVEKLTDIFNPKKKTLAEITFEDYVGIKKEEGKKPVSLFNENVKQADALVNVCRVFIDDGVPHPSDKIDSLADAELIELELIMSDLILIDNRLQRLKKDMSKKKTPEITFENDLMLKLKENLENEIAIRNIELNDEELKIMKGYCFLSQKPMIILANYAEDQIDNPPIEAIKNFAAKCNVEFLAFCAKLEMDISQMSEDDQKEFLGEYNIEKSARDVFIQKTYEMLGLISFFTVGEDEVRAWTITKNTLAPQAAGTIHSDLQRGFIRAETIHYDDFMKVGSLVKAKEKGLLRQEGKTYLVKDGDIINVKFNV